MRKWCGYCTAAERLLNEKGVKYEEIDTTGDHATRRWLVDQTGGRTTVPQIFINGRSIGGYDELRALERKGELDRLLAMDEKQMTDKSPAEQSSASR
ncbi:MAG TPA: glutaredoxin 3 [Kofleriaceae bacterium]|nr:glutaredoxin 3 [Kofleriaceae bacterium]